MRNRNVGKFGAARTGVPGWTALAAAVVCLVAYLPAHAQIVNGGFETGTFTGFSTIGNTSIQTSAFGITPAAGVDQALLSTKPTDATIASLDTFLGLAAGTLDSSYTDGSAINQTFNANIGDTLSFKYNFLTNQDITDFSSGDAGFAFLGLINDFPFLTVGLGVPTQALTAAPMSTGFAHQTGYLTSNNVFSATGQYTISFVVLTNGSALGSGLLVDAVTLTPAPAVGGGGGAVPLPASLWVGMLGALLAAGFGVRMRRAAQG